MRNSFRINCSTPVLEVNVLSIHFPKLRPQYSRLTLNLFSYNLPLFYEKLLCLLSDENTTHSSTTIKKTQHIVCHRDSNHYILCLQLLNTGTYEKADHCGRLIQFYATFTVGINDTFLTSIFSASQVSSLACMFIQKATPVPVDSAKRLAIA